MMIFFSILIALLLERVTPQLIEYRQFSWLRDYYQWMQDVIHIERLGTWLAFALLMLPPLLLVWLLTGLFENALFGLFELAFNVLVIFVCLGPKELDKEVDTYLDAIDVGDAQQQMNAASRLTANAPAMELPAQVKQVCQSLFVEANRRIYAVLFWFVVLGPMAAVIYRVMEQWSQQQILQDKVYALNQTLLGWIDWIPTHLTVFAYMISGSFDEGMQAFRRGAVSSIHVYEQNQELLQNVGLEAIAVHDVVNDQHAMELVRKSRGLILRSLVVWLILLLVLDLL
ncbi:MAG: regulatory signaling modulator protein AmpE [Gammaproteobacteria bacterium]|nr:regulatory signaling modulator protein AmpE [Gammaproteobacteria bacterium]